MPEYLYTLEDAWSVSFSPDDSLIALWYNSSVRIIDSKTRKCVGKFPTCFTWLRTNKGHFGFSVFPGLSGWGTDVYIINKVRSYSGTGPYIKHKGGTAILKHGHLFVKANNSVHMFRIVPLPRRFDIYLKGFFEENVLKSAVDLAIPNIKLEKILIL
jgi:hypothetical protein